MNPTNLLDAQSNQSDKQRIQNSYNISKLFERSHQHSNSDEVKSDEPDDGGENSSKDNNESLDDFPDIKRNPNLAKTFSWLLTLNLRVNIKLIYNFLKEFNNELFFQLIFKWYINTCVN